MTLRARLATLTTAAVALAIVAASVVAWFLIRASLLEESDQQLLERMPSVDMIARMTADLPSGKIITGRFQTILQGDPIGVQLIDASGGVIRQIGPGAVDLTISPDQQAVLDGNTADGQLRTVTIGGMAYRVMSASVTDGGSVLRLFQPLGGVEATMTRIAWLLVGVAGVGITLAGGLGWATARAGLRPVDQLVEAAEQVATSKDLAHRIEVGGNERDEVARLAGSVNAMLAALDSARTQQRELVENAGHELRTPLATLRNDLALLLRSEQRSDRTLSPEDKTALVRDLESEAEVLSHLVAEVVDLARGEGEPEPLLEADLRALIDRAVARTRRVSPAVTVTVGGSSLEAAVRPASLERAVANLIRNAMQSSPAGGLVEVRIAENDGWASVQVLDRGPGITRKICRESSIGSIAEQVPGSDMARG